MSNEKIYTVFTRNWWKKVNGQLVPNAGARKTVLRRNLTLEEARQMCKEWNNAHPEGELSRKAEFTSNY